MKIFNYEIKTKGNLLCRLKNAPQLKFLLQSKNMTLFIQAQKWRPVHTFTYTNISRH